ncbi:hypothetical protein DFJ73DRAFT_67803 [Zopfochytrium polystomum]|nr:hypothetical protein DFJ73DRAFT_67803 [Zopfochytrium polystomum]
MPPIPPSIQTTPPTPEPPAQRVQLAEAQRRIAELESARSSLERKFAELEAEKDNTLTRRVAKFMMQPPASATDAPSSSAASGAGTVAPARPPQTLEEARLRAQAAESKLAMIFAQVAAEDEGIPASSVTSPTAAYSAVAGFMGRMLGSPTASEIGDDDGKRLEAMEETNRKLKEEVLALKARLKVVQEEAVASIRAASEAQLVDASYDAPLNQASKKRRSGDSSSRPLSPFANVEDLRRELSERRRMSLRSSSPLAVDPDNESGRPGSPDIKTIAPNLHITNRLLSETSKRLRSLSESAPNQTLPPRLPSVRLTPATPEVISKEAQTEFDLDSALNRLESALKEEHSRNANLTEELEQVRISRERRESQLSEGAAAAARKVSELERELSATRERLKVLLAEMANLQVAAAKSRLRSASSSSSDSGWGSGGMGASQGSVVDMEEHERVKEENASLRERLAGLSELRTRLIETAARHHTAEEMAEAKSKLERITNELAQLRSAYKAEVAELKAQLEALESERANLVRSLAERETVMRSAAVRVSALEMREVEIQREKEDALAKISALGEAKAAAEASIKELAARLEAVQEHHEKLMKRFEEEQAAVVAQLEATLAETTSALKAAQAAVVELTSRVSAGESAKLETEAALEAATAKVKLLESEAAKVKAALAESANVAAAAHASLAELQSAHADVSGQLEQATKARDVHVSRGVELETAVNCHKNRVSELEASIVELTAKLAAAEEQAALDKARIVELEATAAALVTKVDEATAEATQLKAKMDALETSLVSSVAEVAAARASLEDLTASYELLKDEKTALSAALEDSKQAAQCESETAARHAITTAELEARIKSLDDALATTQAELDAKERELQQLLAADTARAATLLELETKLSAANQRSEELVREVTESQATAGADKAALQSKVAALEAAIGEAEAKIEALEVAKEAVQSDLKRDLEAAQERVESLASELEVMRSATTTPRDLPLEDGVSEGLSNRSVDPSLDVDAIQNHLEELNAQAAEAAAIAQKVAEMEQIHIQERERLENRILELEEALRVAKDMTRAASPKTIGRADPTELNARVTGLQYRVKELESQLAAASQPQVARSMSRSSDSGDESVR